MNENDLTRETGFEINLDCEPGVTYEERYRYIKSKMALVLEELISVGNEGYNINEVCDAFVHVKEAYTILNRLYSKEKD